MLTTKIIIWENWCRFTENRGSYNHLGLRPKLHYQIGWTEQRGTAVDDQKWPELDEVISPDRPVFQESESRSDRLSTPVRPVC